MYVEFIKSFHLADSSRWWVLDSFRPPEPKKVWSLLSRHDVRRVHEKFSWRRFERAIGCLTHFSLLSPKTFDSYFLDMMYGELMKNFLLPIRANWWVLDSFRLPQPKNVSFLFSRQHVRRVHEKYLLADSSQLMGVRLISAYWPKNVSFLLYRHHVRRIHEKCFSRRFERTDGC